MLIISHASEMRGLRPTSASSRPRLPAPPSVDLPKGLVITPPSGPPVAPGRACGGWRNVHKLRASPKEEARRQDGTGAARQHSHIPPRESRQHRPRRAFLGGGSRHGRGAQGERVRAVRRRGARRRRRGRGSARLQQGAADAGGRSGGRTHAIAPRESRTRGAKPWHWSRHTLACLRCAQRARCAVSVSAPACWCAWQTGPSPRGLG